jgi:4-amino-4-deoxy-L-arabinose transferase-like glycosyltransferase
MGNLLRRSWFLSLILAVATCGWLLAVEGDQGIGRDEAQYFRAGERYWGWFESVADNLKAGHVGAAFSRANVDAYWGDNHEHPALAKALYGLSWRLFHRCDCPAKQGLHPIAIKGRHRTLPLFGRESTAFRFPAIMLTALGLVLVFLLARQLVEPPAAVAAAVLSVAQPHYFFHAQIAAFDVPITVMLLLVVFAYWKSLRSPRWGILCGVFYGLALATKHNAWMLPFFLLPHYLWMRRGDLRRLRPPRIPLAFVSMAALGPLVLVALWPWLWHAPVTRTRDWFQRHLQHEHYNFEYLGRNWNLPPERSEGSRWWLRTTFPFVSAGLTIPVTTLALVGVGTVVLVRRRRKIETDAVVTADAPIAERATWLRPGADVDRAPGMLLAVQILAPMAVLAVPSTPIFGGVKHFMTGSPYLAIVAGVGVAWLGRLAQSIVCSSRWQRVLPAAVAALVCVPAVAETQRSHPDGLGHYNLIAGGFAGGASIGMNRQFWGYSVEPLLPWIAANRPPSNRIYWHDVLHDALVMYMREGRLPLGTGDVGVGEPVVAQSELGVVILEKHFGIYEYLHWEAYGTTQPARVYTHEGVPFVVAYRRPTLPPAKEP